MESRFAKIMGVIAVAAGAIGIVLYKMKFNKKKKEKSGFRSDPENEMGNKENKPISGSASKKNLQAEFDFYREQKTQYEAEQMAQQVHAKVEKDLFYAFEEQKEEEANLKYLENIGIDSENQDAKTLLKIAKIAAVLSKDQGHELLRAWNMLSTDERDAITQGLTLNNIIVENGTQIFVTAEAAMLKDTTNHDHSKARALGLKIGLLHYAKMFIAGKEAIILHDSLTIPLESAITIDCSDVVEKIKLDPQGSLKYLRTFRQNTGNYYSCQLYQKPKEPQILDEVPAPAAEKAKP